MKYTCKILLLITLLVSLSNTIVVNANTITKQKGNIESRMEVTTYKYITVDGIKYKRLWSVTYNQWINSNWNAC